MNECHTCHQGEMVEQLIDDWQRRRGGTWMLFKNLPALVCNVCGEIVFSMEQVKRMESLYNLPDEIIATGRNTYLECDVAVVIHDQATGLRPVSVATSQYPNS